MWAVLNILRWGAVARFCEHDNKISGSLNLKFHDHLNNYRHSRLVVSLVYHLHYLNTNIISKLLQFQVPGLFYAYYGFS